MTTQHTNEEKFMNLIENVSRQLDFFIDNNKVKRGYILIATEEESDDDDNVAVVLNTNNREKLVTALADFISAPNSRELCNDAALLALNVDDTYLFEDKSGNKHIDL